MKTFLILVLCWLGLSYSAQAAVNINTANQTELESLPGIGPVKAKAILEYRKKNGGFKSVDELTRVDGIGPVTLKNARNDIVLDASAMTKPTAVSAYPKSHADSKKALKQAAPAAAVLEMPAQPTRANKANKAIIVPAKAIVSTKPATTATSATPTKLAPAKVSPVKVRVGGLNPGISAPGKSNPGLSKPGNLNPAKQPVITAKPSAIKPSSQKAAPKKP
ncbi:Competence protein ComEA, helix-hairpin-helix domain [Methylophilaceae bacterium]